MIEHGILWTITAVPPSSKAIFATLSTVIDKPLSVTFWKVRWGSHLVDLLTDQLAVPAKSGSSVCPYIHLSPLRNTAHSPG
jgi:hypothetical protein